MNDNKGKIFEMVQQLMPHLFGNRMSGFKRYLGGKGHIDFRMQAMTKPASTNIRHFFHLRTCAAAWRISSMTCGSTPSSILEKICLPLWITIPKIATVMISPTIGSASG